MIVPLLVTLSLLLEAQNPELRANNTDDLRAAISAVEKRMGGRIGVAALDLSNGRKVEHRAEERFPMCSTFKFLAAAAILARVDAKQERLDSFISYSERDLLAYAPVTREHVREGGMTIEALCAAGIEYSDNTAGNLLVQRLGGPVALTKYARSIGDELTRLDRAEPDLNNVIPRDPRDTTTPAAMLNDMRQLLTGDRLSAQARGTLEEWMARNTTGQSMIRAALPAGWQVGDKTGRNAGDVSNDIAIIRPPNSPPNSPPLLLCVYIAESPVAAAERDAAIAEVAKLVIRAFSGGR